MDRLGRSPSRLLSWGKPTASPCSWHLRTTTSRPPSSASSLTCLDITHEHIEHNRACTQTFARRRQIEIDVELQSRVWRAVEVAEQGVAQALCSCCHLQRFGSRCGTARSRETADFASTLQHGTRESWSFRPYKQRSVIRDHVHACAHLKLHDTCSHSNPR
jgi:hypothetical protein